MNRAASGAAGHREPNDLLTPGAGHYIGSEEQPALEPLQPGTGDPAGGRDEPLVPRAPVLGHHAPGGPVYDLHDLSAIALPGVEMPEPADMIAEISKMADDRVRTTVDHDRIIRQIALRYRARIVLPGQSNLRQGSVSPT